MGLKKEKPIGPSQRQLRVGELTKRILSEVLQKGILYSPTLDRLPVTICEVRVSPDLRGATVFAMTLNGQDVNVALKELNSLAYQLRMELAKQLRLRVVPTLKFIEDKTFSRVARLDELLGFPSSVQNESL